MRHLSAFTTRRRPFCSVIAIILFAAVGAFAGEGAGKNANGRIDPRLAPVIEAMNFGGASERQLASGLTNAQERSIAPAPSGEFTLQLDVPKINEIVLQNIAATGAQILHSNTRWNSVTVSATLEQTAALAELPNLRLINLAQRARTRQRGISGNQGDAAMKADLARNTTGLTGAGQKIGTISDSFNDGVKVGAGTTVGVVPNATVTGTIPQSSGDLPASVQIVNFGPGQGTDEGEGMMELIFDIAPGAAQAFGSCGVSQTEFADTIRALRTSAKCTITVDDIFFLAEPYFQDGPIAQAINDNFDKGVPHFTAAGNDGDLGSMQTYLPIVAGNASDGASPPSGNDFHNWQIAGATPQFLPIDVPAFRSITLVMQWNQPHQSFALGAGSSVDMDCYLFDAPNVTANLLGVSEGTQFFNGQPSNDPIEGIDFTNNSASTQRVYLAVNHFAGSRPNNVFRITYYDLDDSSDFPSGGAGASTISGHSATAKSIAVGAIFYADIATNGARGPDFININAESFSSKGGVGATGIPFYFDTAGNPAFSRTDKPDIAAPDGVDTSVFGGGDFENNGFPNFFGTSCAAPNCAAVAALLMERASLSSPAQLRKALQSSAIDIQATAPLSGPGFDAFTGSGLVDAVAAAGLVPEIKVHPVDTAAEFGAVTTFTVQVAGAPTLNIQWLRDGVPISGENGTSLSLNPVKQSDTGAVFSCTVSNEFGVAKSKLANLVLTTPPPAIITEPADAQVNLGGSATFTVAAGPGDFSYQWKRGGVIISGATSASYATLPAVAADDGALFQCFLISARGNLMTRNAKLTVNFPPVVTSGPTAAPLAAAVGQGIQFSAAAQGSRGQAVTLNWNFGNVASSTGSPVGHAYSVPGIYTVSFSAVDIFGASTSSSLTVFIFNDVNADGLPDLDAAVDNSSFVDTLRKVNNLAPQTLSITKLAVNLSFSKPNADGLSLTASVPLRAGFTAAGKTAVLIVGGLGRSFTLDAKGIGSAKPNGVFKLSFNTKRADAQFGKLAVTISKADLKAFVAASGLTDSDAKNAARNLRATVFIDGGMFDKNQAQIYNAKKGKSGKTK